MEEGQSIDQVDEVAIIKGYANDPTRQGEDGIVKLMKMGICCFSDILQSLIVHSERFRSCMDILWFKERISR